SGIAQLFTGKGTYFMQNGVAGACGAVHKDSDFIVALQTAEYANGAHCGKQIKIMNKANKKTATATVADECPTCVSQYSVDFSQGLFESMAALSTGEIDIEWGFVN
ncbi:barwin-like endoglucanase, partial [Meira miltonrushii]